MKGGRRMPERMTVSDNTAEFSRLFNNPQELIKLVYFVLSSDVFVYTINGKFSIPKVSVQNLKDIAQDSLEYIIKNKDRYDPTRGSVSTWIKYCVFFVCQRRFNFYNNSVYLPAELKKCSEIIHERELGELGLWLADFNQEMIYDEDFITSCDIGLMLEKISKMGKKTQDSLLCGAEEYGVSLSDVGKKYGVSRESIRIERNRAISKLKKYFSN